LIAVSDALADAVVEALDVIAVGDDGAALEAISLDVPALDAAAVEPDAEDVAALDGADLGWFEVHAVSSMTRPTESTPTRTWEAVMASSLPR
jgi:hypothetical protein